MKVNILLKITKKVLNVFACVIKQQCVNESECGKNVY